MEPGVTTTSAAEALGVPAARRVPRIRLRQLVVPVLVLAVVGVLGGVAVTLRHQTQATDARLAGVRAQLHQTARELAQAQATLQATEAQAGAVQVSVTAATAQLQAVQGQLSQAELSQFIGGVTISALQTCLGGVQLALNELGLGNEAAAVAQLQPVAASCRVALGG